MPMTTGTAKGLLFLVVLTLFAAFAGCSPPRVLHLYDGQVRAPEDVAIIRATKQIPGVKTYDGWVPWHIYVRSIDAQRVGRELLEKHDAKDIAVLPGTYRIRVANTLCQSVTSTWAPTGVDGSCTIDFVAEPGVFYKLKADGDVETYMGKASRRSACWCEIRLVNDDTDEPLGSCIVGDKWLL